MHVEPYEDKVRSDGHFTFEVEATVAALHKEQLVPEVTLPLEQEHVYSDGRLVGSNVDV